MSCHASLRSVRGSVWTCIFAFLLLGTVARAQTIVYQNFGSTDGLTINGDATALASGYGDGQVLRLAPQQSHQAGSVFTSTQYDITGFSTVFEFRLSQRGGDNDSTGKNGADGIAFVLQTVGSTALGGDGSGIGYGNIGTASVAIEFDTFKNNGGGVSDPSSNHVGFNQNGTMQSVQTADVTTADFDNGTLWTAWVDYDGSTLEVRLNNSSARPVSAALVVSNLTLSSSTLLNSSTAFVGFTSATGAAVDDHDLVSWKFSDQYIPGGIAAVPEPSTYALLGLGGLMLLAARRFRRAR